VIKAIFNGRETFVASCSSPARPADASGSAQTITATVTGSVKDGQGGVIPAPPCARERGAVPNPPGRDQHGRRLRLPERLRRHLQREVSMSGFKALKRGSIIVGAGNRVEVRRSRSRSAA
jgi:hypothetical protein